MYYFSKLEFWSVLSLEMILQKSTYIKSFPTYIFFYKPHFYQISGDNEATEFPEYIMQIYAYTISRENCVTSKVEKNKTIPEK